MEKIPHPVISKGEYSNYILPGIELFGPIKSEKFPCSLRYVLESAAWKNNKFQLPLALGKDDDDNAVVFDLAELQHILIGGQTGSGKSICMYSILGSLLSKFTPDELHLVISDLKMVEFTWGCQYLPHLQIPLIHDHQETLSVLEDLIEEINCRMKIFEDKKVQNITEFNAASIEKMPRIVFLIDDLADLMFDKAVFKKIEASICSLAELGENVGIHLIVCTQRPDLKVFSKKIRKAVPARIAFKVANDISSRIILDSDGAEKLAGYGDMLIKLPDETFIHAQGAYWQDDQVKELTNMYKPPAKINPFDLQIENIEDVQLELRQYLRPGDTQGFLRALEYVYAYTDKIGISYLQRNLKIGYNRAAEYIELMLERGAISRNFMKYTAVFSTDDSVC